MKTHFKKPNANPIPGQTVAIAIQRKDQIALEQKPKMATKLYYLWGPAPKTKKQMAENCSPSKPQHETAQVATGKYIGCGGTVIAFLMLDDEPSVGMEAANQPNLKANAA
jgi:hypothetical protein